MTKRSLPNMQDVADLAGVSLATVDRVMHQRPGVRRSTVARVMSAAAELNYFFDEAQEGSSTGKPSSDVVFLLPDAENSFARMLRECVQSSEQNWAPFGVNCRVETVPPLDPEALADAMLRHGRECDGLAFVAVEHPLVREAAQILADEGVGLVTMVSDTSGAPRAAFVGMDNLTCGRTAAYMIGRFVGGVSTQVQAKVILISGSLSLRAHVDRQVGFMQVLREKFPRIDVVGLREGLDEADNNFQLTASLLAQHPDTAAIYCIGGGPNGIARAIALAKLDHHVVLVGHDLTPMTREMLSSGSIDAVMSQAPQNVIGNVVRIFANLRDENDAKSGTEPIRVQVVFRESMPG